MNKYGGNYDLKGWANNKHCTNYDPLKNNIYQTWMDMLKRCYFQFKDNDTRNRNYNDCTVCERWYTFSLFVEDFQKLDGYEEFAKVNGKGYSLDKDTVLEGNRVYSPDTCIIIKTVDNVKEMNSRVKRNPIIAINVETGEIKEFDSAKDASRKTNFNQSSISLHIKNGEPYKGYIWRKKEGVE